MLSFITWNVDPVIFNLGPLQIRWYSMMFAVGFLIGYNIVERMFRHDGAPEKWCPLLLLWVIAGTIIGALSRMEVVVSMRLHALIFAAGQGIPLAGVVYDPKVSAFLKYIGQELFVDLDALTEDALRHMIDQAVRQSRDPEGQAAAVARLRSLEQQNVAAARRLLDV